jgi:hypothetical protein
MKKGSVSALPFLLAGEASRRRARLRRCFSAPASGCSRRQRRSRQLDEQTTRWAHEFRVALGAVLTPHRGRRLPRRVVAGKRSSGVAALADALVTARLRAVDRELAPGERALTSAAGALGEIVMLREAGPSIASFSGQARPFSREAGERRLRGSDRDAFHKVTGVTRLRVRREDTGPAERPYASPGESAPGALNGCFRLSSARKRLAATASVVRRTTSPSASRTTYHHGLFTPSTYSLTERVYGPRVRAHGARRDGSRAAPPRAASGLVALGVSHSEPSLSQPETDRNGHPDDEPSGQSNCPGLTADEISNHGNESERYHQCADAPRPLPRTAGPLADLVPPNPAGEPASRYCSGDSHRH